MNGVKTLVAPFAKTLRLRLWKLLLGYNNYQKLRDPICDAVHKRWLNIARNNLATWEKLGVLCGFAPLPHHVRKLSDFNQEFQPWVETKENYEEYEKLKSRLKGFILPHPDTFLIDETKIPLIWKAVKEICL